MLRHLLLRYRGNGLKGSPQKQSSASAARKAFSLEAGTVFLRTRRKGAPPMLLWYHFPVLFSNFFGHTSRAKIRFLAQTQLIDTVFGSNEGDRK